MRNALSLPFRYNSKYTRALTTDQLSFAPNSYVGYIYPKGLPPTLSWISEEEVKSSKWTTYRIFVYNIRPIFGYLQATPIDMLPSITRAQFLYRIRKIRKKNRVYYLILNLLHHIIGKQIVNSNYIFFQKALTYI